jgi:hypothetical protein
MHLSSGSHGNFRAAAALFVSAISVVAIIFTPVFTENKSLSSTPPTQPAHPDAILGTDDPEPARSDPRSSPNTPAPRTNPIQSKRYQQHTSQIGFVYANRFFAYRLDPIAS